MKPDETLHAARDIPVTQRLALMRQAESILARDPKNVDALLMAAGIRGAENNATEALALLQRALAARKKDPEILRRLVGIAFDTRQFALARKYARRLCTLRPRDPAPYRLLGLVHEHAGNPAAAIEAYSRADRLAPDHAGTLYDIGKCYANMGDHEKARQFYEATLKANPDFGIALYGLSRITRFTPEEADRFVARVEQVSPRIKEEAVRANIQYAAAKAMEDAGRHDRVFAWLEKANALRAPKEPEGILAPFTNMKAAFDAEFLKARAGWGAETQRPIFILGLPRSGTTLVESLCGAHSAVTAADELLFITRMVRRFGRDGDSPKAFARNLDRLSRDDVGALADEYIGLCGPVAGETPHFTDKLPHNFLNVGFIHLLFPQARIIHCRRHPLDNCHSLYANSMQPFHNRYKTDLTRLGIYYRQYAELMAHWRAVLPDRMLDVFYEDVVVNTEMNARRIVDHLGLEWEDGVMDRTGSQRSVRTLSGWQVRQPVYQTSSGKWRHYEKELAPLIEALGPHIRAYETELAALDATAPEGGA